MRGPGKGVADQRRCDQTAPVKRANGDGKRGKREHTADIVHRARVRPAMGAEVSQPELVVGHACYIRPASTTHNCAVHIRLSSEASHNAIRVTSAGASFSFRHCTCIRFFSASGVSHSVTCRSVMIQPGITVFTLILSGPRSRAMPRVSPSTAAFAVV